jgi:serine/threonine protein kinase
VTQDALGDIHPDVEDFPRRVGSFEILGEIGRGGMGIVYRARDTQLGRMVALKCPKREVLAQPEFRKRFLNEARTASKIMHPHITAVFEVFEEDDVPWMAMELVDGDSIRSIISDRNPMSCEDVLKHAEGLTDALRVAHSSGVLHMDINPNNILVGRDGRARLSDFGLARAWIDPTTDPGSSQVSTHSQSSSSGVAGTRGYMSPEQALGKPIDPRSDVFSLGAVLYEMCTGRPAFHDPVTGEWLDALLHREPQPISRVNHDVPIEFEEVVRKSLAKRTFQRYQSANEMLLDLRAVRRKLESDSGYSVPSFDRKPWPRARWRSAGSWSPTPGTRCRRSTGNRGPEHGG